MILQDDHTSSSHANLICPGQRDNKTTRRITVEPNMPAMLNHNYYFLKMHVRLTVFAVLVESWAAGILQGDSDLAVMLASEHALGSVRCPSQSDGAASLGWSCLFRPMPHVCVFDNEEVRGHTRYDGGHVCTTSRLPTCGDTSPYGRCFCRVCCIHQLRLALPVGASGVPGQYLFRPMMQPPRVVGCVVCVAHT